MIVPVRDPDAIRLLSNHDLRPGLVHTNLQVSICACRPARPVITGNTCLDCGGMMIRTGTCYTCTECATTGGCG